MASVSKLVKYKILIAGHKARSYLIRNHVFGPWWLKQQFAMFESLPMQYAIILHYTCGKVKGKTSNKLFWLSGYFYDLGATNSIVKLASIS